MALPKKRDSFYKGTSCRICLQANNHNPVVFEVCSEWSSLFKYCFGINVDTHKGPRVVCRPCSEKVKQYSDFKTLALKSDDFWNNVFVAKVVTKKESVQNIKNESNAKNEKIKMRKIEKEPVEKIETVVIKEEENVSFDFMSSLDWGGPSQSTPIPDIKEDIVDEENEEPTINDFDDSDDDDDDAAIYFRNIKAHKHTRKRKIYATNQIKDETVESGFEPKEEAETELPTEEMTEKQLIRKFFCTVPVTGKRSKICYQCLECGDEVARRGSLAIHVRKCYQVDVLVKTDTVTTKSVPKLEPKLFYCGLCDYSSPEDKEATNHFNEHIAQNDFNCKLCNYVGRDAADMVTHRYGHMPSEFDYKMYCPACHKIRMNILSLQFHYRSVHLNKPGGLCSVCDKKTNDYKYFRNHERLHTNKGFICDFCGMKFLFRNLIKTHIREHMNVRDYVCETCGKTFKRKNALNGHIRAYHSENKPVNCDHCGKKYKNQYNLNLHMKKVRKDKNFICDVCSKGYSSLRLLQNHMFWHTGEKPYACETCGARYKAKGALKIHIRKHTGYFPYKCELCEKEFISSNQLKIHTSVHTGIRRVKCLVCDKTFHEKKRMLEHCQSKHESVIVKLENQLMVVPVPPT